MDASGDYHRRCPSFQKRFDKADKSMSSFFMGFDEANENSIYNSILKARENARSVRPELTSEVWEQINFLYYCKSKGLEEKIWTEKIRELFFSVIKKNIQLLYGILDSTISRTDGSGIFGKIGQLLERADKTAGFWMPKVSYLTFDRRSRYFDRSDSMDCSA